MKDDQINFRILFRSPKYPAIVIAEDDIWPAFNIEELGTICVLSEPLDGSKNIKVVDSTGEEFWFMPEQIALAPGFMRKRWTKKQIIGLFNSSETAEESKIQYSLKSLSNKRLNVVVLEICNLLRQNMSVQRRTEIGVANDTRSYDEEGF